MFAIVERIAVPHLADIDRVLEQLSQWPLGKGDATNDASVLVGTLLGPDAARMQFVDQRGNRPKRDIPFEDQSDSCRFIRIDKQLAIVEAITDRDRPAHPHPLAL